MFGSLTSSLLQTEVVSAKFVMKTDDDAFVRVDEVLASLKRINVAQGLLYGLINSNSRPHRNPDSKWYISHEVTLNFGKRRFDVAISFRCSFFVTQPLWM